MKMFKGGKQISIEDAVKDIKSKSSLNIDSDADEFVKKYKNARPFKKWGPEHFHVAKDIIHSHARKEKDLEIDYIQSLMINYDTLTDHQLIANILAFVAVAASIITTILGLRTEKQTREYVSLLVILVVLVMVCFIVVFYESVFLPEDKFYKRVVYSVYEDAVKEKASKLSTVKDLIKIGREKGQVSGGDSLLLGERQEILNGQKVERYVSTAVIGILGLIGGIEMGTFDIWVYFVSPFFWILELIFIKFDICVPKWRICSFSFYIISGILGSMVFNYFEMGIKDPKAYAALLYLLPCLWFLFNLFNPKDKGCS